MVAVFTGLGLGVERGSSFLLGSRGQLGSSVLGRTGENVYVNAATGNLAINRTDEILLGMGADASIGRNYNSLGAMDDDNGDNWRLNASRSVTGLTGTLGTDGSTITRTDWDGSQTLYRWDGTRGLYVSQQTGGTSDTLGLTNGIWTWADGATHMVETYDDAQGGRILTSADVDGHPLSFSYTGNLLTRVTTADGEHVDLAYSGNNLTQLITTRSDGSTLSRIHYDYDEQNRLIQITIDLSPDDNSITDGKISRIAYEYDGDSDRIIYIGSSPDAVGLFITYILVGSDYRVASVEQKIAGTMGAVTGFSYDTMNLTTSVTDARGQVSKLVYDTQGRLIRLEQPDPTGSNGPLVSAYSYTTDGQIASATDPQGLTTSYAYDAHGNLILERDAAGNTIGYAYDAHDNLVTETHYLSPDPDGTGSAQPGQPVTTRYAYDGQNRLLYTVSPTGRVTQYIYGPNGLLASVIDYAATTYDVSALGASDTLSQTALDGWSAGIGDKSGCHVTDTAYDFRGNVSSITTYSQVSAAGAGLTSAPFAKVSYVYDQAGYLLSRHDNRVGAGTETYIYDGLGRLIGFTDLAGQSTSILCDDVHHTSATTNPNGVVTTLNYDRAGDVIRFSIFGTDGKNAGMRYSIDGYGHILEAVDGLGQATYFVYDYDGRKVADVSADGTLTEYVYNADGQIVRTIQYANKLSASQLDSLNATGGITPPTTLAAIRPALSGADRSTWNIYDQAGRLVETIDPAGGATVFTYDGASQLLSTARYANAVDMSAFSTTLPTTLQLPTSDAIHDQVSRNFYDSDGLLIGTLDADGALTQFVYDGAGEKIRQIGYAHFVDASLRATGSFASLLANAGSSATDNRTDYVYDDEGQLRFTLDANARPTEFVYDASGHLIRQISYAGSVTAAASYSYAGMQNQVASLASDTANRVSRFVYDAAGRQAYAINAAGIVTATSYDAVGHVIRQAVLATGYSTTDDPDLATMQVWASSHESVTDHVTRAYYDSLGRPSYAVDAEGYVTETQYDVLGEVLKTIRYPAALSLSDSSSIVQVQAALGSSDSDARVTSYAYDSCGRVIDVTDAAGVVTHYAYDTFGEVTDATLAYGTADAVTTHSAYDGSGRTTSITQAYGSAIAATTSFQYDALGRLLSTTDARGNSSINSYDALGRLIQMTDPAGAVTSFQYDAFGNRVKTTDARGNASYAYYDALDRLVLQIDAEGYATATSYSIGGAVSTITHYATRVAAGYGVGSPPSITANAAKDEVTRFTLDKLDRVTQVTDAEGNYEQYSLDAFGNRVSVRNKLGGITSYVFDRRGLVVSQTRYQTVSRADGSVEATSITTSYSYDARGNLLQQIDAVGLSEQRGTSFAYDKLDRMVSKTGEGFAVLGSDKTSTSVTAPTETFSYDLRGNLIEHRDAAGGRTLSYYDTLDRKTAALNALGTLSTWTYDANGNVTAVRVYGDAVALPATPGGTPPSPVNSANYRETLYLYDKDDRQIETRVVDMDVGEHANGSYSNAIEDIVTATAYDAAGNVTTRFDGRGNAVYSYYDRNGHKIAEVDQENYLTTYDLDADGNVLTETRYANRLSLVVGPPSDPATLKANAGTSTDNRITQFSYDRNGHRLTETRLNMVASTVSSAGALTTVTTNATVSYSYNALGLVTRKTEANGDYTDYSYDGSGRLTEIAKSGYVDSSGNLVHPTTDMQYDGLDELVRQIVRGTDGSTEADDRITSYSYDKAGHVVSMTDATGFVTSSFYDIAGNLVKQSWVRTTSSGASLTEADFYSYDLLGHQLTQQMGTYNGGTSWTLSESTDMRYDAYGEMVARGINTGGDPSKYQEFADYDAMGRVWRTNFNDGATKAYLYDANGNATLLLQSTGNGDLRSMTLDQMVNSGGTVTETQSVFDKRNQLVETIQPSIANAAQLPGGINSFTTSNAGQNFSGGAVDVGASHTMASNQGSVSGTPGSTLPGAATTVSVVNHREPTRSIYYDIFNINGSFLPNGGNITIVYHGTTVYYGPVKSSITTNYNTNYSLEDYIIFQDLPSGQGKAYIGEIPFQGGTFPATVQFQGENPNTTGLMLFARPSGSSGPYSHVAVSQMTNSAGAALAGNFSLNPSSLGANGSWDIKYYAMDASGNTLNSQTATLTMSSGTPSITNIVAQPIGGSGKAIITQEGGTTYLIPSEQSSGTQSVRMRYRVQGSGSAWSTVWLSNGGYGQNGLWVANVTGWGGTFEYTLEDFSGASGSGSLLSKTTGTFSSSSQPSALKNLSDQPETVHFYNQPAATSMKLWYKPAGSSTWIQAANPVWKSATGSWDWDANSITPDKLSDYQYDFRYEVYNGSVLVNQAHGQVQLGYDPLVFSNIVDQTPATVVFLPSQTNATTLILNYRVAGSTGAYTTITLARDASGKFSWNADALRPASGSATFEYFYDLKDSAGHPIAPVGGQDHATGYVTITSTRTTSVKTLQWTLVSPADPAAIIDRQQAYNAFGEIASETDGLGHVTTMAYDVMGKLILKQAPEVEITDEHGVKSRVSPTEHYYYDLAGRLVGVDDANGNRNTLALLANSGEDGSDAITLKEFHADGGVRSYGIDVFGDVRTITNELGAITLNSYDRMDRLIQVVHPTRVGGNSNGVFLTDTYAYDGLGQRIQHWNSQFGSSVVETTDYDIKSRVIQTKDLAGNVTGYSYSWSTTLSNDGTRTLGGLIKTVTDPSGHASTEQDDYFGRIVAKTDFGGHSFTYGYNSAGQILQQNGSSGQNVSYTYYGNGYICSITDNSLKVQSTFEYDKEGNRTLETYSTTDAGGNRIYYQVADITYDEMNRIKSFTDAKAKISYEYDADSNRRRVLSQYQDGVGGNLQTQDFWYKYDSMNRFVLTMGQLVSGNIQTGTTGVQVGYDKASQRVFAINGSDGSREDYTYTADGYLEDTKINNVLRARRVNDALGRVTTYTEYLTNGTTLNYSQASTYDGDNRVTDQVLSQRQSNGTYVTTNIHNDYRADTGTGSYTGADQGVITHSRQQQQGSSVIQDTLYSYQWWDDAKQIGIQVKGTDPKNPNSYQWAPGASQFSYDVNGHLKTAIISGATPAVVTYMTDAYGQVLEREQKTGDTIGPRQLYYYFDGNRIGDVGNNGPSRVDYATALAQRGTTVAPGAFRYGAPVSSADFDQNYEPIGPNYPGMASTSYTVRGGDTLSSIAQEVWGDSSLWYLIADANGLTDSDSLAAGQLLNIPNKVTNIHNRAGVYRVYNPGEAIGDLMPTLPAEPAPPVQKHGGCGALGQILMVAVAVAVSVLSYGALTAPATGAFAGGGILNGVAAGVISGTAGSVASQTFGVAIGVQDHFSFKGVALAAIAGGVGGGIGASGILKGATGIEGFAQGAARGIIGNGLSQGLELATGLQSRFDWAGVAAAGISGGVLNVTAPSAATQGIDHFIAEGLSGAAAAVAASAARSLLTGSDFSDNVLRALPDVVGQTIGSLAAEGIARIGAPYSGPTATDTINSVRDQAAEILRGSGVTDDQRNNPAIAAYLRFELANGSTADQLSASFSDPDAVAMMSQLTIVGDQNAKNPIVVLPDSAASQLSLDSLEPVGDGDSGYGSISGRTEAYDPRRLVVSTSDYAPSPGEQGDPSSDITYYNSVIMGQTGGNSLFVGPLLIQGGSYDQRVQTAEDINAIFSTPRGRELEAMAIETPRQERVLIDSNLNSFYKSQGSSALGDYQLGVLIFNPKSIDHVALETSKGWQDQQRVPILAHELGHVVTRVGDDGAHHMSNVLQNENPIRKALGYAPRVQYADREYVTVSYGKAAPAGIYATTDGYGTIGHRISDLPPLIHGK
jgi:YD repeat-containing protein